MHQEEKNLDLYEVTLKLIHPSGKLKTQHVAMHFYGAKTALAYANTMYKRYMYFEKGAMLVDDISIHKLIKVKEKTKESPSTMDDDSHTDGDA